MYTARKEHYNKAYDSLCKQRDHGEEILQNTLIDGNTEKLEDILNGLDLLDRAQARLNQIKNKYNL
ncbi:MAG: hypothetical protein ABFC34_10790 [Methanobacterium sp.]